MDKTVQYYLKLIENVKNNAQQKGLDLSIEREFVKDATTGLAIKEYLMEEVRQALPSDIQVLRTPLVTRIVLKVARPALVIGRKGHRIKQLTETLRKKFRLENPQIEVVPVQNSTLDAPRHEPHAPAYYGGWCKGL